MNFYPVPPSVTAEVHVEIPHPLRCLTEETDWTRGFYAASNGIFLEGPVVDKQGNLFVVDVAYGRILKIDGDGNAHVCVRWDGEPNGLAMMHDGKIIVADYKQVRRLSFTNTRVSPN
jgi:sugar lactone lactonase YvrE